MKHTLENFDKNFHFNPKIRQKGEEQQRVRH